MYENDDSGQASIDFLVGMSIFALTVIFVLQFTTGSLITVSTTSPAKEAVAERTAALLYSSQLTSSNESAGVLNATETGEFFRLNHTQIRNNLSIPERYDFNISVKNISANPKNQVVLNLTEGNLYTYYNSSRPVRFANGSCVISQCVNQTTTTANIVTERRIAYID
ncbi:MAG: hypothetical protein SXQ77_09955, partial [Halobacteria archaeon]|nr:hypothetical protein [Halobacteria archaeon]